MALEDVAGARERVIAERDRDGEFIVQKLNDELAVSTGVRMEGKVCGIGDNVTRPPSAMWHRRRIGQIVEQSLIRTSRERCMQTRATDQNPDQRQQRFGVAVTNVKQQR